jgi:predicted nucleotidyltransferase
LPAAPVGENIGGPFLQRGCRRREQVIELLHGALLPLAWVNAAWLGGSDAFGRADELSDVDLQVDVDDGHVAATFGAVEAALAAASPIVARLVMPMPTWHGHAQRFYRLRDTAEFTAVDVVVFQRSDPRRYYNQTERHGRPLVLFDRAGVVREVAGIREGLAFTLPLVAKEVRAATPWPPSGSGTAACWPPWSPSTGSATPRPATTSAPATPATTCPPRSRRRWPSWRS